MILRYAIPRWVVSSTDGVATSRTATTIILDVLIKMEVLIPKSWNLNMRQIAIGGLSKRALDSVALTGIIVGLNPIMTVVMVVILHVYRRILS